MRHIALVFLIGCSGTQGKLSEKETTGSTTLVTTPTDPETSTTDTDPTTDTDTTTTTSTTTSTAETGTTPTTTPSTLPIGTTLPSYGDCIDPVVMAPGIALCADGSKNRYASDPADPTYVHNPAVTCQGNEEVFFCNTSADCSVNGFCQTDGTGQDLVCKCKYSCETDAGCGADRLCLDGRVTLNLSSCIYSSCNQDSDCASGECALTAAAFAWEGTCRESVDTCRSSADCSGSDNCISEVEGQGLHCVNQDAEWD